LDEIVFSLAPLPLLFAINFFKNGTHFRNFSLREELEDSDEIIFEEKRKTIVRMEARKPLGK
jgi:hypothetical protein